MANVQQYIEIAFWPVCIAFAIILNYFRKKHVARVNGSRLFGFLLLQFCVVESWRTQGRGSLLTRSVALSNQSLEVAHQWNKETSAETAARLAKVAALDAQRAVLGSELAAFEAQTHLNHRARVRAVFNCVCDNRL